jgi:hypothetical protein
MKKIVIAFLIVFLLLSAVEAQKYALGAMQPVQSIQIVRGDSFTTKLYFYNVFGDRTTHIRLWVGQGNPDWVKIEPEEHFAQYEVAETICNITENIAMEPKGYEYNVTPDDLMRRTVEPGELTYILSPGREDTYIPARVAYITFDVPEDAKVGSYTFRIDAEGEWFGDTGCIQPGAVVMKQGRQFLYDITVVSGGPFYERPITPTPPPAPPFWEQIPTEYIIFAVVIVLAMAGMYYLGRRGR